MTCKRFKLSFKPRANGHNIVGCYMLHPFAHPVACCCAKFETGQTIQPITPNILLFSDRRSVAQQCWIHLHSSSNIVGATHAHYTWITKTHGLYLSHNALQVPTCWELLHPFAHHCQQACYNFQHCWRNNVGSCCACLQADLNFMVRASFNPFAHEPPLTIPSTTCDIISFNVQGQLCSLLCAE